MGAVSHLSLAVGFLGGLKQAASQYSSSPLKRNAKPSQFSLMLDN